MNAFLFPEARHTRRHGPRGYTDVESYRPWLRDEFKFRCVYCLFREQWGRVKAGFSLDHFLPVSVYPEHQYSYDNLLSACVACNLAKGANLLPDPTRVLIDGAVQVYEDGRIEGKTRARRASSSACLVSTVAKRQKHDYCGSRSLLWRIGQTQGSTKDSWVFLRNCPI